MTFKCDQCDRQFAKKSKLNRHVRETHMNIKQYVCDECGKNFKRNSHLKRHLISHSENPKPHKCSYDGCYMAFTCKHHLERHIKIIHIEEYQYKCTECDAKFPKKVTLNKHLTYDHGKKKPLTCQLCQKTFFKLGQFEYHHCEEKFKQLNLELIENDANQELKYENESIEKSKAVLNYQTGDLNENLNSLVNKDDVSAFHNTLENNLISNMLHDDQSEPINIPVIDVSSYSRKNRQRNYNYQSEYLSAALNSGEMTPELGAHINKNDCQKRDNSQQNQLLNNNLKSNCMENNNLSNQIQPPIKKKFKPVYQENQNFTLSGEQQPLSANLNKQDDPQNDENIKNDSAKQLPEITKEINNNNNINNSVQSKDLKNNKVSFEGESNENESQDQYFKQKHVSFAATSTTDIPAINSTTGLLMPEANLQAALVEQSKLTEAYNKVSIKVEDSSAPSSRLGLSDEKKYLKKQINNNDSSEQIQQQQQAAQIYYEQMQQENSQMHDINREYIQDAKQEYDTINLDLNNNSGIHNQFGQNAGVHNLSQNLYIGNMSEYHYKSPQIKPNGRKLSEMFNMNDFKERKNSYNSDYGNLTIFKDLFLENSFNSRRASMNIVEQKNNRKGSLFHLQKMEEDGIIVDLDQGDMNNLLQPTQSQELHHHHLQGVYDQLNNTNLQNNQNNNININPNINGTYQQSNETHQQINGNSQQYILSQINHLKETHHESHENQKVQQIHRSNRQNINQNKSQVTKQGYTSNNPQLHHHIYQQREVSPQIQYNPDSAKVGYTHSPYIPLVVRSKSPTNSKKKEEKCYKCNYENCDKFYTKLSNLKTHIRTFHFKSKDFKCNYQGCKSAYLHKKSLKEHIARVHKIGGADYEPRSKRNSEDYEYSDEQQMNQINQNQKDIHPKIKYDEHDQQYSSHIPSHPHHITHHHQSLHPNHNEILVNQNMYAPTINYHQQFIQQQQQQQQQQSLHHNNFSQPIQTSIAGTFYPYSSQNSQNEYSTQPEPQLQIPILQQAQSQQPYQSGVNYSQLHRNLSLQSHHPQQNKSSVFMA